MPLTSDCVLNINQVTPQLLRNYVPINNATTIHGVQAALLDQFSQNQTRRCPFVHFHPSNRQQCVEQNFQYKGYHWCETIKTQENSHLINKAETLKHKHYP